jgi:hypothetical protein
MPRHGHIVPAVSLGGNSNRYVHWGARRPRPAARAVASSRCQPRPARRCALAAEGGRITAGDDGMPVPAAAFTVAARRRTGTTSSPRRSRLPCLRAWTCPWPRPDARQRYRTTVERSGSPRCSGAVADTADTMERSPCRRSSTHSPRAQVVCLAAHGSKARHLRHQKPRASAFFATNLLAMHIARGRRHGHRHRLQHQRLHSSA